MIELIIIIACLIRHGGGKKFQQGHHQGGRGKGRGKWNKRQQHHQPQRQQGGRERGHEYGPGWHKCTVRRHGPFGWKNYFLNVCGVDVQVLNLSCTLDL